MGTITVAQERKRRLDKPLEYGSYGWPVLPLHGMDVDVVHAAERVDRRASIRARSTACMTQRLTLGNS